MQNVELKAGELVCFSTGEYSDYGYTGHFVALRDVSQTEIEELAETLRQEEKTMENSDDSDVYGHGHAQDAFLARAIQQGWLLSVNCREIHYGNYSRLDLS